ncbi:amidase domain-containing protein [Aquibacillus rhizosphaerae]|uniref:Amidase domain-containing protein n=1 Tax=Aquibacillus rhizosphaerae TaxID=3051431 RepID=A0ABT7L726_9BACI|nr:amidase domain-containing protein [Aquibacillus sp. LR5S19]MDL4840400.1 amidase domain-containing protein [Aquibacillus sp. LR5S19]
MKVVDQIKKYWSEQLEMDRVDDLPNWILDKKKYHEKRGNKVPRISGKGRLFRSYETASKEMKVEYNLNVIFFVKNGKKFYHEEDERFHQALFYKGTLVEDKEILSEEQQEPIPTIDPLQRENGPDQRFEYDRRTAVQYAERWWNDYNPDYKKFSVDCTNYVSQCLHAGGAPMKGAPNRGSGWWYEDNTWSYSWAVAHSLRWYLSGSNQGLKGKELENAIDLLPGDIICYDFEGDGKWDHNTIVVDKDNDGMPLVNAHTNNSRHRYWSYEDSYAWTSECKYKFFRIGE